MALLVVMTRVNLMTSHPYWNVVFKCRNSPCSFHRFIMYVTVCYRSALTSACSYNEIKSNGFFFSLSPSNTVRGAIEERNGFSLSWFWHFFFPLKKREKCVQNVVMRWIIFGIKVQLFYWTINFSYIFFFLFIFCFHIHRSLLIIPVLLCLWCRLSTDSSLMGFLAIALSCQFFFYPVILRPSLLTVRVIVSLDRSIVRLHVSSLFLFFKCYLFFFPSIFFFLHGPRLDQNGRRESSMIRTLMTVMMMMKLPVLVGLDCLFFVVIALSCNSGLLGPKATDKCRTKNRHRKERREEGAEAIRRQR